MGCLHQFATLTAQGTLWKRRWNDCTSQVGKENKKKTRPSNHSKSIPHGSSEKLWQHGQGQHGYWDDGHPSIVRGNGQPPTHTSTQKLSPFARLTHENENMFYSNWVSLGIQYTPHTRHNTHTTQHTTTCYTTHNIHNIHVQYTHNTHIQHTHAHTNHIHHTYTIYNTHNTHTPFCGVLPLTSLTRR